ncbi:MAG: ABC transporter permease [Thermomicrobiales bacterium]
MLRYIGHRVVLLLPVLLGITVFVFLIMHLIPGDPALVLLGQDASRDEIDRLNRALGLDRPLPVQLGRYVARVAQGDLGDSIFQSRPVGVIVLDALPATIELAVAALAVAALIGVPLGVLSAVRQNSIFDYGTMILAQLGVSMPIFWLGILLILVFSVRLGWLPTFGRGEPLLDALGEAVSGNGTGTLRESLRHLAMPAVALGFTAAALITRMVRSSVIEVLAQDYIRTARAKGLREQAVVVRHALRNALLPVVTIIGLQFGALLGGAVITETIFAWPGVGRLVVTAIGQRDFPLVQGAVLILALLFSLVNLVVDLLYAWIDPQISYGRD